jgi:nitrate/nitrite-specific signal transduction histidine kinase
MVLLIYARRPRATLPVPLAVQKLTRLYMSALLLLGLLLLSGQLVIQAALSDLQQDARVLNLAGRQRMLSQELLKCVLVLNHAPAGIARQPYATELRDVLLTWRQTHRGLREGDTDLGLPSNLSTTGLEQYKQLHAAFMKLFTTAHALLAAHDADDPAALPPLVLTALRADTEFRTGMDGLVRTLENEARERVMWVRGWNCLFSWPRCWY